MKKVSCKKIYQHSSEIDAEDNALPVGNCKSVSSYATFNKHTPLGTIHKFIYNSIKIYHKDVEINDPIIGKWDVHPFLRHKYKITIEEIYF